MATIKFRFFSLTRLLFSQKELSYGFAILHVALSRLPAKINVNNSFFIIMSKNDSEKNSTSNRAVFYQIWVPISCLRNTKDFQNLCLLSSVAKVKITFSFILLIQSLESFLNTSLGITIPSFKQFIGIAIGLIYACKNKCSLSFHIFCIVI